MSVILALDIGNTFAKLGVFHGEELVMVRRYTHAALTRGLEDDAKNGYFGEKVKYIGMVSVGKEGMKNSLQALEARFPDASWLMIDHGTVLPVRNAYATPQTLGMDRICAAAGAVQAAGKGPILSIDAGTAITYDFVDAAGAYQGGGISPGIRIRFRALHDYTAALPMVELEGDLKLVGDDTVTSIRSGVVNGVLAEIDGVVAHYRQLAGSELQVYLTGGDAEFLGNHLKNINFVDSNLLLRGVLAIILNQNHA